MGLSCILPSLYYCRSEAWQPISAFSKPISFVSFVPLSSSVALQFRSPPYCCSSSLRRSLSSVQLPFDSSLCLPFPDLSFILLTHVRLLHSANPVHSVRGSSSRNPSGSTFNLPSSVFQEHPENKDFRNSYTKLKLLFLLLLFFVCLFVLTFSFSSYQFLNRHVFYLCTPRVSDNE